MSVASQQFDEHLQDRAMVDSVQLRDGYFAHERDCCHCEICANHPNGPLFADRRYSLGVYAGRMCDDAWAKSGYRDDDASAFDPADAGEAYGPEDY